MSPDWVSNPGPLTYESGVLLIALRGPAIFLRALDKREYLMIIFLISDRNHIL